MQFKQPNESSSKLQDNPDSGFFKTEGSVSLQTEIPYPTDLVSSLSVVTTESLSVFSTISNNSSPVTCQSSSLSDSLTSESNMEVETASQNSLATESSTKSTCSSIRMTELHQIKIKGIKSLKKTERKCCICNTVKGRCVSLDSAVA